MTQIVALATPELVVVATDRQLTYPDGTVADDQATKLILFGGRLLIAYTGLARIGHVGTGEWLSRSLANHSLASEALPALTQALNKRWLSLRGVADERLAIVGVGAAHFDGEPCTYALELANHGLGQQGVGEFRCRHEPVDPDEAMVRVAGQPMPDGRRERMIDELGRARGSVESTVAVIAAAMSDTARGNDRVGKDLLVGISSQRTMLSACTMVVSGGSPFDVHISALLPDGNAGGSRWHSMYMASGGSVAIGEGRGAGDWPFGDSPTAAGAIEPTS